MSGGSGALSPPAFRNLNKFFPNVKPVRQSQALPHPEEEVKESTDVPSRGQRTATSNVNTNTLRAPKKVEENPFSEEDSEKNLLFVEKKDVEKAETDEQVSSEIPQIRGATLLKLVERLTYERYADPNFQSDFLLTFRSFTTASELLDLLIKRYNISPPKNISYAALQDWKQNQEKPIRLRVINFFKNWLEKHWKDFTEEPANGTRLHEFLMEDMSQSNRQSAEQLTRALSRMQSEPEQQREVVFSEPPPKPILPNMKKTGALSSANLGLLDLSPEEIARQLALIEFNLYKAIKPWEFFNQQWTKKDREVKSPNVIKMIHRFNHVSHWVTTEIVTAVNLKQRITVLSRFIEIADYCRHYNNFNALMEIVSGLQSSGVFRLHQTWAGISTKNKQTYDELTRLMTRAGNFSSLRKHFKSCDPPLIPYLGLYLTDLTFIEDGNPDLIEGGLINWQKRRKLATVLKDIQQYQQKPYNVEEVSFIQEYLMNRVPLSEDECYKLSLYRETRGGEGAPKSRGISGIFRVKSDKDLAKNPGTAKSADKRSTKSAQEEVEEEDEEFEIQYSQGYKFYDKDSEHNIIIERGESFEQMDVIIAGTQAKLIERLTYEKYPDTNYLNSFLLTFRTFITPMQLMELLMMRYHTPPPITPSPDVMERFKAKKELPIQLRVYNALKMWVTDYFEDFTEDKTLLTRLLEFIEKSMIPHQSLSRAGENLKAQISLKLNSKEETKIERELGDCPKPILPNIENPVFLDYDSLEFARQLIIMEFGLFTAVKPLEFLRFTKPSSWLLHETSQEEEDPQNIRHAPHVVAILYRFNDIRDWVATEILKRNTPQQRAGVIEHFLEIAQHCLTLKNFQSLVEIISGLTLDFILDLKATWQLVPLNKRRKFNELRDLVNFRNNWKAMRDKLQNIVYPCIPYLGMLLQDLSGIKEQLPDIIEPGSFVNFAKRQKLAVVIHQIVQYHQLGFALEPVPQMQEFLKNLDIYELTEMRGLSEQYQDSEGAKNITEDVFNLVEAEAARGASGSLGSSKAPSKDPSPSQSSSSSPRDSPRNSYSQLPRSGSQQQLGSSPARPVTTYYSAPPLSNSPPPQTAATTDNIPSKTSMAASPPQTSPRPTIYAPVPSRQMTHSNSMILPRTKSSEQPTEPVMKPTQPPAKQPVPLRGMPLRGPAAAAMMRQRPPLAPSADRNSNPERTHPTTPQQASVNHGAQQPLGVKSQTFPAPDAPNTNTNTNKAPLSKPSPVSPAPAKPQRPQPSGMSVDEVLRGEYPDALVEPWTTMDASGTVYGWPEDICAHVVTSNDDVCIFPQWDPMKVVDNTDLSVFLRVGQLYESMNRLSLQKRPTIGVLCSGLTASAQTIANKIGVRVILLTV